MTDFRRPQPERRDASSVAILAAIFERPGMTNRQIARLLGADERCVARKTCAMRKLGYLSATGTIPHYSYIPQHPGAEPVPEPPKETKRTGTRAGERLLMALAKADKPMRPSEIAAEVEIEPNYAGILCRRYEERGLLRRVMLPTQTVYKRPGDSVDTFRITDYAHYEIANKLR